MIEIRNVSKGYNKGRIKAVDGLDLTVRAGEIFAVLAVISALCFRFLMVFAHKRYREIEV